MRRLVFFGDPGLAMARSQVAPFLRAAAEHPRFEAVAVVNTGKGARVSRSGRLLRKLRSRAMRYFNPQLKGFPSPQPPFERTAGEFGVSVVRPDGRNVNSEPFRAWLSEIEGPLVGVSLGCLQIFKQPLLDCFEQVVNFHNGLLPEYRGVGASAWSMYNGEERSGFSFHRMTAGLDDGPVLVDGAVPIDSETFPGELEDRKLAEAAMVAPRVLDAIDRQEPGRVQDESRARVYYRKDLVKIVRIENPEALSADEIRGRIRCFGQVWISIDGRWWPVTEISDDGQPAIPNADGERMGVRRAKYVPPGVYRLAQALRLAGG